MVERFQPDEILREGPAIVKASGLGRSQRDELIKQGKFPKPVRLSARRKGWLASEVAAWQLQRIAERDGS
jgi:prophage regulatory protein